MLGVLNCKSQDSEATTLPGVPPETAHCSPDFGSCITAALFLLLPSSVSPFQFAPGRSLETLTNEIILFEHVILNIKRCLNVGKTELFIVCSTRFRPVHKYVCSVVFNTSETLSMYIYSLLLKPRLIYRIYLNESLLTST